MAPPSQCSNLYNAADLVCLNDDNISLRWVSYDNFGPMFVDVDMLKTYTETTVRVKFDTSKK